ncbi:MAG: hypothetical protein WC010_01430 [Candidatus Absconditabacterales bacterium]
MSLITEIDVCQRKICLDNVRAVFTENTDGSYDVILEINSNKFLIVINHIANQIDSLEIIATKGFVEISNKIILMIKKLIEHLRYRLD